MLARVRNPERSLVAAFVVFSTIVRIVLAHTYYGFQTGDDLEIAEEAFRRAVSLVHAPWNIRSLLIPDLLVAPVVWLAHAAGIRNALTLAEVARYPFIALSAVNIVLVYVLGRRWYGGLSAVIASGLYAFHWIPLVYGSSLYVRTFAVTCILWSAIATSGVLAALAVTARYSEAIYFLSLLLDSRRKRLLIGFAFGIVVFIGLYDRLTWGRWFGSLLEFAELTFVRRDASSVVVSQPPWWYLSHILHWMPVTLLPFFIIATRRGEARRALAFVAMPLLILSAIFHKELRYLQVILPFALLIAARGFVLWWDTPRFRRLALVLLVLSVPLGLTRIGTVRTRTTNAVTAALWIAQHHPPVVALSQPWAYGGRLFLGNTVEIIDLDIPPDVRRIRRAAFLAIYSSDVNDALRKRCIENGLTTTQTFTDRGGRDVTVFFVGRAAGPPSRAPLARAGEPPAGRPASGRPHASAVSAPGASPSTATSDRAASGTPASSLAARGSTR